MICYIQIIKGGMNMKELIMNNMEFIVTFTTMVVVWILGRISKKSKYVDNNVIIFQNITVGLIVTGIYYWITGDLSKAVMLSGLFATTGYDMLHNIQKLFDKKEK